MKKYTVLHYTYNGEKVVTIYGEETPLKEVVEATTRHPDSWVEWNVYVPEEYFLQK